MSKDAPTAACCRQATAYAGSSIIFANPKPAMMNTMTAHATVATARRMRSGMSLPPVPRAECRWASRAQDPASAMKPIRAGQLDAAVVSMSSAANSSP